VLPQAAWQRSYVHCLRNALDCVPSNVDDDWLEAMRYLNMAHPAEHKKAALRKLKEAA